MGHAKHRHRWSDIRTTSENPPGVNEPDLTEPGKPMIILVDGGPYELEQTKFDNCQDLMGEIKDEIPTDEDLARWNLTLQEYAHFVMDLHDHEADRLDIMAADIARIEQVTGKKVELPETVKDRLGFRRLKDPPPEGAASDETPAGREPPPGTSWGDA
jgi:hypothetical protein